MVTEQDKIEVSKLLHPDKIQPSEWYSNQPTLRSSIAAISPIGTFIDVYFSTHGQKYATDRIIKAIELLNYEVQDLIRNEVYKNYLDSEEFFDLIISFLEKSVRTRHEEKVKLFARIIKNGIILNERTLSYLTEDFINIINEMNMNDLVVLHDLIFVSNNPELGMKILLNNNTQLTTEKKLQFIDPSINAEIINPSLKHLSSLGLIYSFQPGFSIGSSEMGYFASTNLFDELILFLQDYPGNTDKSVTNLRE